MKRILALVVVGHGLLLSLALRSPRAAPLRAPVPLQVRTHVAVSTSPPPATMPPQAASKQAVTKKQIKREKRREVVPSIPKHLAAELEDRIARLDAPLRSAGKKARPEIRVVPMPHLQSVQATQEENDYADALIAHLQQHLALPEFGQVQLQITLRKEGGVAHLVVLKSESEKNREYLEDALRTMWLPPFTGMGERTIRCTFCN